MCVWEGEKDRELTEAFNLHFRGHNCWREKSTKIKTISFGHGECRSLHVIIYEDEKKLSLTYKSKALLGNSKNTNVLVIIPILWEMIVY